MIILGDEVVEVVVGLQNHAAAAPAVAAARPALGDVGLAMECDAAFAAVPRACVNFNFVYEHEPKLEFTLHDCFQKSCREPGEPNSN